MVEVKSSATVDTTKPTRVSARIKEKRHRLDPKKAARQTNEHDTSERKTTPSDALGARKEITKRKVIKSKVKEASKPLPSRSSAFQPNATRKKSSAKALPPLCRRPPYPFYRPLERPTFQKGIDSIVEILRSCKNIAVLTGAGISVSCGIPDFRSKGVGLYSVLDCADLGLSCPEELFDWEFFQNNPRPFFQFAKKLYFPLENNQKVRPSDSHRLLRILQDRKQLLRVYSQNIDGLEEEAGVLTKKIVYAHGSLKWATCLTCKHKVPAGELEQSILRGDTPLCQVPSKVSKTQSNRCTVSMPGASPNSEILRREPSARQRKRPRPHGEEVEDNDNESHACINSPSQVFIRQSSTSSSGSSNVCGGILKPNVTFFGQVLPDNVSRCLEADRKKVDALIVIGTSLSVAPISKVIGYLPANIPRILINRTIVHPRTTQGNGCKVYDDDITTEDPDFRRDYAFDAYLLGNCDDVTRALVQKIRAKDSAPDTPPKPLFDDLVEMGRLLSEVQEMKEIGDDKGLYDALEWERATVPPERVFLFPGAQPPTPLMEEPSVQLQEVCHCNECSKRIRRGCIHKCLNCFDFDLCNVCYPKVSPVHYNGEHQFTIENVNVAPKGF